MPSASTAILVGDLVRYNEYVWLVMQHDKQVSILKLRNWEDTVVEAPNDRSEVQLLARPSAQWPFVAAPVKSSVGPVEKVFRAETELVPLTDWVPSAIGRSGGSIFFNPQLRLRVGEVLVAHHRTGRLSRINITPAFGTVGTRRKREAVQNKEPLTLNQRLLSDDSIFEESDS